MKWQKLEGYKGVRYREHPTRKHGVKKDRYFAIRYKTGIKKNNDGKNVTVQAEEGLGWASEGWTAEKAAGELAKLKEAHRTSQGPKSLKEKRDIEQERRAIADAEREKAEQEAIILNQFYQDNYLPLLLMNKAPGSIHAEKILFAKWIKPYIGAMSFKDIYPLHIEKIKKAMTDKGKAARSIEYVLSVIRQIWNLAKRDGLIDRDSPTKQVKKPKFDNKRTAFFTHEQADTLLEKIKEKSEQLHNMSLLSLHTGMRACETFKLRWSDLNVDEGLIHIKDAKGGSRVAYMTDEVKAMFQAIKPDNNHADELIFKNSNGEMIKQISNSFDRVINDVGFNEGITDRRQKLTFHSLRHTFASWLVMQGEPLYTVQKLMGHKTIALTERYAHLAPDTLKAAVAIFEKNIKRQKKKKAKVIKLKG
ncbi:tyrosine-type recombinase/integrase [Thermodesulfobacteriota bacterium]